MKIRLPNSSLGVDAFADFYRWPEGRSQPAPLLLWIGGAIAEAEYERRREEEPEPVRTELERARERLGSPPLDALVLSSPPSLQSAPDRLDTFARFLAEDLFSRVPPPLATSLALVGNSFGAHLAMGIACRRPESRAVATIAGVGLWDAIRASGGRLPGQLALRCFANEDDFAGDYADELLRELHARGRTLDLVRRPGDHPYADYAANGSVTGAFLFVITAISGG